MPRSYTTKGARRFYVSRSQRVEAKRARRKQRALLRTDAQEAARIAGQARTLERGLTNMRGGNNEQEKPTA